MFDFLKWIYLGKMRFSNMVTLKWVLFFVCGIVIYSSGANYSHAEEFEVIIPPKASEINSKFHFVPSDLQVKVLDQVIWKNNDSVIHTVTSGSFSSGPNDLFNSGPLEPGDTFSYQFVWEDTGVVTYFCTIHPWVNALITVIDPEGVPVGNVAESGSLEFAEKNVVRAKETADLALEFNEYDDVINSHRQAARHYTAAALEYDLLKDNQNSAKYYQEAALQFHYAAVQLENSGQILESTKHHYLAGIEYHNAALQYLELGDYQNYGKQFAESLLNKRMAKYGSDYVLSPKLQMNYSLDPHDVVCKADYELIFKSTNFQPACVKPSSVEKLIKRGWASGHDPQHMDMKS